MFIFINITIFTYSIWHLSAAYFIGKQFSCRINPQLRRKKTDTADGRRIDSGAAFVDRTCYGQLADTVLGNRLHRSVVRISTLFVSVFFSPRREMSDAN